MPPEYVPRHAVACYWSPFLALALFAGNSVMMVKIPRVKHGNARRAHLQELVSAFAEMERPDYFVIEERTMRHLGLEATSSGHIRSISVSEVKAALMPKSQNQTHHALYEHLLAGDPELRRFVTLEPKTGHLTDDRPWQTLKLLAIALGLAAQRATIF